jgi:exodeoxyribonuclease V gamma subunit
MNHFLFLSQSLEALAGKLVEELPAGSMELKTVVVPHGAMKQWLLLEIAKRRGIAMGLKMVTIEELVPQSSSLEVFCSLYREIQAATDPDLMAYLGQKEGRLLSLTQALTPLFFSYGQYGKPFFDSKGPLLDWQHALLRRLFVEGSLRMPVQTLPQLTPPPLICFGIDALPPLYWDFLLRAPSLSLYLFSPCREFWEDVCTSHERRKINRHWKKKGATEKSRRELDAYLQQAPLPLANWGKLGREALHILDAYPLQIEEVFAPLESISLLKRVQSSLLDFQPLEAAADDSIQVFQTGPSPLHEIETVRDEILKLRLPLHEVAVLAPDIEAYVPLIEFAFANIPYRIAGFDLARQSSFRWGLVRLLDLGRWEAEKIVTLLETPAFARKQGWEEEKLAQFRVWISAYRIEWGRDLTHCRQTLVAMFGDGLYDGRGSWEEGLDRMLDTLVYLRPESVDPDLFEELLRVLFALQQISFTGTRALAAWADALEALAAEFLQPDLANEADAAAYQSFQQCLHELRTTAPQEVPFEVIEQILFRPCSGQIHPSHLHAIRFASLEEAAFLPAKAIFLIGMDEEKFPRLKRRSSLDLLRRHNITVPDRDRYLFLQALFAAQERLCISYGHLSADEGKPVSPSLLVQELMSFAHVTPLLRYQPAPVVNKKENPFWPDLRLRPAETLPAGETTITMADLRLLARHPWKFFLQKVQGIYVDTTLESSFDLQRAQLLRATLQKPLENVLAEAMLPSGIVGEALQLQVVEKRAEWQEQLDTWGLKPFTFALRDSDSPLVLKMNDQLTVRIVGEIHPVTAEGFLSTYEDQIGATAKVWPDALAAALALHAPHLLFIKSGKKKMITDAEKHLKSFIAYYFQCLKAPSPLLPDWVDALLRKNDLAKVMKKGTEYDDPVVDWVLARSELPAAEEIQEAWSPYLKEVFQGLVSLYPSRQRVGNHEPL